MNVKHSAMQWLHKHPQVAAKLGSLVESVKPDVTCSNGQKAAVIIGFDGEVRLACCTPGTTSCTAPLGGKVA